MGSVRTTALASAVFAALVAATPSGAAPPTAKERAHARAVARSVVYHSGRLVVRDASIVMPSGYRYLAAHDAQRTLDLYGNVPDSSVRGLILPPGGTVLDADLAVVVRYEDDGHVSDRDAAKIDYSRMLRSLQKDAESRNAQLVRSGYDTVSVLGWADEPRYDASTHKLYWAKRLQFGGDRYQTLNYEVRVLGREGTLSLNAIADAQQFGVVRKDMQAVLAASSFRAGRRYEDFRKGDRVSTLTVAGLVAGGAYAIAKTGLLAVLLAKLKFLLFGLLALGASVRRRVRRMFRRGGAAPDPELF